MAHEQPCTAEDLQRMRPAHDSFAGIDSDGCVFDTMEVKQRDCFHPLIISMWGLEPIEPYLREAAEYVNLYSKTRGRNRFFCLYDIMALLRERPEVQRAGVTLPDFAELKRYTDSGVTLSNETIKDHASRTGSEELARVVEWSEAVNRVIAERVRHIPPYPWVRESLERMQDHSDIIVVSQTPHEALQREWAEHGLDVFAAAIAGQELGTKSEHLALAADSKYAPERILMIGDAPGDLQAARDNNACFYPINPGHEEASWERFYKEAYDRFLAGTYHGDYEDACVREFDALLPDTPPWKRTP
jgi:phosphoglycolate phosphatase-like HAD superfamily hydrolase